MIPDFAPIERQGETVSQLRGLFLFFIVCAMMWSARAENGQVHRAYEQSQRDRAECETSGFKYITTADGQEYCDRSSLSAKNVNSSSPSQIDTLVAQCQDATESAKTNCDFSGNSKVQQVLAMANGFKSQIETGATSNPAALCSQMGSLAQASDAAVAAYTAYCSAGYSSCSDACDSALKDAKALQSAPGVGATLTSEKITEIRKISRECAALSDNIQMATQNVQNYVSLNKLKSQTCGKAVGVDVCVSDPTSLACQQKMATNCSNPTFAATSTVCICMKNPNDSRCGNSNFATGISTKVSASGSAGGSDSGQSLDSFGGLGGDTSGSINDLSSSAGAKSDDTPSKVNNAGRANVGMNGGSGGGGRGGRGGSAGSEINTKIIGGYGMGRGGSGGSGGGGPGSSAAENPAARGGAGRRGSVDLHQFLPGGKMDPSRVLAGISGPDGITGPNTDIWTKINTRYFAVSPGLLP